MSHKVDLYNIFTKKLSIKDRIKYLDSLFIAGDWAENTNFHPSYQRNYVWSEDKGVYFIESILLGTEFPPLIYYSSDSGYEIIDGRQRYETIHRFLNDEFHLRKSGLRKLSGVKDIVGKKFSQLPQPYQELITESKVRIMECSFMTEYTQEEENAMKREIFKRYNSCLIPLKVTETDHARYIDNNLNMALQERLENNDMYESVNDLVGFDKFNKEKLMKRIRDLLVRPMLPIKFFVNNKGGITTDMFEYLSTHSDPDFVADELFQRLDIARTIMDCVKEEATNREQSVSVGQRRLMAECLIWAISVMTTEDIDTRHLMQNIDKLTRALLNSAKDFSVVKSAFSANIMMRYRAMAQCIKYATEVDLSEYVCNSSLSESQQEQIEKSRSSDIKDFSFEDLRLSRPNVVETCVDDISRDMKKGKWLIRPSYQRNEQKDLKISSAIIESLLLGMKLPPIFLFQRDNGIKEVIDGQQRLLTVLAFVGESYMNADGLEQYSIKNEFKLNLQKGILKDLHGKRFRDLEPRQKKDIRNAVLNLVVIEQSKHPMFDPIDLFVRLNSRPFPIKPDTFEMWNSFVDNRIVDTAKKIAEIHSDWFFLRRNDTRMENPNLIVSLAYLYYQKIEGDSGQDTVDLLDIYVQGDEISIRLKNKDHITRLLERMGEDLEVDRFIDALNYVDFCFIRSLIYLTNSHNSGSRTAALDNLLGVTRGKRTLQGFYALWVILEGLDIIDSASEAALLFKKIRDLVSSMTECSMSDVFKNQIKKTRQEYSGDSGLEAQLKVPLKHLSYSSPDELHAKWIIMNRNVSDMRYATAIAEINNEDSLAQMPKTPSDKDSGTLAVPYPRAGIDGDYILAILGSSYFYHTHQGYAYEDISSRSRGSLPRRYVENFPIPYTDLSTQQAVGRLMTFISVFKNSPKWLRFLNRMRDVAVEQLYWQSEFRLAGIDIIAEVKKLPIISIDDTPEKIFTSTNLEAIFNNPDSHSNACMLKATVIENDKYSVF